MCGRYTLKTDYEQLVFRFNIGAGILKEDYQFSYNIAPSHSVTSIINDGERNRLGYLRWGMIPNWANDEKIGYKMINARAETIFDKPSFRHAAKKQRCLIIADSFYEWKRNKDHSKTPMRIKLTSGEPFAMAGLWSSWKSPTGEMIHTCTIITTKANELMESIHDRMPVILRPEDEQIWLNPTIQDPKQLGQLLKPFDSEHMEAFEVSLKVNSPQNNSPDLLKRIG